MAAVTICSDFGAQKNKVILFPLFPHLYTIEYYSAIKRNTFESVLMRWMNLEPIIQSGVKSEIER